MKRMAAIFTVMTLALGAFWGVGVASAAPAQQVVSTDLNLLVGEVVQLAIGNCGTVEARTVKLTVGSGGFSSCKLTVNVGTNSSGYKLFINSVDTPKYHVVANGLGEDLNNNYFDGSSNGSTNLVLVKSEPPTVLDTTKVIPPFAALTTAPADMSDNTTAAWGFAVPNTQGSIAGFDASYNVLANTASTVTGKYAGVPTAQTQIRARTGAINSQNTDVYFGTRVPSTVPPGNYKGIVLFSVIGEAPEASGGGGDNTTGETGQIGGQDITRDPADVGTGSFQPNELTYVDTSDGTPEPTSPEGVTKTRLANVPNTSQVVTSTLSLVSGAVLLAVLLWLLFALFRKKHDVLLLEVGPHRHKVAEVVKKFTKLTASDSVLYEVFEELSGKPLLLVEKVSKGRAKRIVKALSAAGAEAKTRVHRTRKKKK
jgi:hypothetical protein